MSPLMIEADDLTKWTVLSSCTEDFLRSIVLIKFFGSKAESALITSTDDSVYIVGHIPQKFVDCEARISSSPVEVSALCGKCVTCFCNGDHHWLALTASGAIYAWGANNRGQLGLGTTTASSIVPVSVPGLPYITAISCGRDFSLALSYSGEVFAWGWNLCKQCGKTGGDVLSPVKVMLPGDIALTSISCGFDHVAGVGSDKKVYCWGNNAQGQLGREITGAPTHQAAAVALDTDVSQVHCGRAHSVALTTIGHVFTWGWNSAGLLGLGSYETEIPDPRQIEGLPKVNEIMVTKGDLRIACTDTQIFIWGEAIDMLGKVAITKPEESKNLTDVLANRETMSLSIKGRSIQPGSVGHSLSCINFGPLFNQADESDLTIEVGDRKIYCHKMFLRIACPHFKTILSDKYFKQDQRVLKVEKYNPEVYFNFLQYIYKNILLINDHVDLIEMYHLSEVYRLSRLKNEVLVRAEEYLAVDNAIHFFESSFHYKASDLEELVTRFIVSHFKEIARSKPFKELDSDTMARLIGLWATS